MKALLVFVTVACVAIVIHSATVPGAANPKSDSSSEELAATTLSSRPSKIKVRR